MFFEGDYLVYPAHGVGRLVRKEKKEVSGSTISLFVIEFPKEKLVLRVSSDRAKDIGLRYPSSSKDINLILSSLSTSKIKQKKIVWNKRAQEYSNKINTGDPFIIAEVIKDISATAPTMRSYSEKLIYKLAITRLSREISIVKGISEENAIAKINLCLGNSSSNGYFSSKATQTEAEYL